ncbi:MAG TPA: hypothetical protein VGH99_14740 [Pseudonocardia sp.]
MLEEANRVVPALRPALSAHPWRRILAVLVLAVTAAGLWATHDRWWPWITSASPYDATPAENFPVGADGIRLPDAQAVPGMTAPQVAAALGTVRDALQATYLDPALLNRHDPATLLSLLAPDSATAVRARLDTGQYGTTLIRFSPGVTLAATPRVSGQVNYHRVDWDGLPALDVTSNYVIAYAFALPSGVVVVHAETHWMFPLGNDLRPSSRGMYLGRTTGYWHGMDCTAAARGLTAPAPGKDARADPNFHDTDPLDAYFDRNRSTGVTSGCR